MDRTGFDQVLVSAFHDDVAITTLERDGFLQVLLLLSFILIFFLRVTVFRCTVSIHVAFGVSCVVLLRVLVSLLVESDCYLLS